MAVIAVMAGVRAGHLHDRRPHVDLLGLGQDPGGGRDGVRAPRLGRPNRIEAERLGLLDDVYRNADMVAGE